MFDTISNNSEAIKDGFNTRVSRNGSVDIGYLFETCARCTLIPTYALVKHFIKYERQLSKNSPRSINKFQNGVSILDKTTTIWQQNIPFGTGRVFNNSLHRTEIIQGH